MELREHPAILSPFVAERTMGWEPVVLNGDSGLREVRLGTHYPICMTKGCLKCGTTFSDVRFSDEEMGSLYYRYQDSNYNERRCHYEREYKERIDKLSTSCGDPAYVKSIEKFIDPSNTYMPTRILDWGGDTGLNTPFRGAGVSTEIYDICGNEPVGGIYAANKDELALHVYDLIVCSNVLEHVSNPYEVVWSIAPLMDEDTLFYIEVPFEDVPFEKKNFWHEHINMFTVNGIRILLLRCGLTVIRSAIEEAPWEGAMKPFIRILCKKGE
jgi:hypothetical protein